MANVISLFLSVSGIGDLQGSLSISIQHCCLRLTFICSQSPLSAPTFWIRCFPVCISLLVLAAIPCGCSYCRAYIFTAAAAASRCCVNAYRLAKSASADLCGRWSPVPPWLCGVLPFTMASFSPQQWPWDSNDSGTLQWNTSFLFSLAVISPRNSDLSL